MQNATEKLNMSRVVFFHLQRLKHNVRGARFTSSGMQDVIEHGVLFHKTPDNSAEQKKVTSVLKYWVIGYVKKIDINRKTGSLLR